MLRIATLLFAFQIAALLPAFACEGQTGKVIFEDTFDDDSGGWGVGSSLLVVKPPEFVISPDATHSDVTTHNLTFHTTDGDYCMEFYAPQSVAADNTMGAGLDFWATDYVNRMSWTVFSNGNVGLYSQVAGKWTTIFNTPNVASFKAAPDAVNSLRVIAKAGKLTLFLNGTQVKVIRAQVPDGKLQFGFDASLGKAADGVKPLRVKSYKVTEVQ